MDVIRGAARLVALAALLGAATAAETTVKRELLHARQAEDESEKIPDELFLHSGQVLEEIYFAPASARLTASARAALDDVVARWIGRDAGGEGAFIEIRGHSDGSGNIVSNLTLARRRAETVERYLRERGMPPERLVALALGPSDPAGDDATPEGRARNRRVEVVAVGSGPAVE